MTNEEKKTIELLKKLQKKTPYIIWVDGTPYNKSNQIQTVLNLIENQQKEIEELKEKTKKCEYYEMVADELSKEIEELRKDKLELINKNHVVHLKDVEKELREMRKEVDTKNAEIQCLNVIHESYKEMMAENNYISKDKIKAKIEEVDENGYWEFLEKRDEEKCKDVLQSLLEKE